MFSEPSTPICSPERSFSKFCLILIPFSKQLFHQAIGTCIGPISPQFSFIQIMNYRPWIVNQVSLFILFCSLLQVSIQRYFSSLYRLIISSKLSYIRPERLEHFLFSAILFSPAYFVVKCYSTINLFFGRMPFSNTPNKFERTIGVITSAAIASHYLCAI